MMQVAISRLAALWPPASIQVFTAEPNLLAQFCPAAIPLLAPVPGNPSFQHFSPPIPPIVKRLLFTNEAVRRGLRPLVKYIRRIEARGARTRQTLPRSVL